VSAFLGFFFRFLGVVLGIGMLGLGQGRAGVGAHLETSPMTQDHTSKTDVTLLARLRHDPKDQAAWGDFVARYGPKILDWCRRWGLQQADAQDVTQEVLLKLNRLMATFVYDPAGSFQAWLKTVAHHTWCDFVAQRRRAGMGTSNSKLVAFLENPQAGADLAEDLQDEFRLELLDRAMARVRPRVASRAWDAFRLTALEGWSGSAAGAHLQMKVAQVYLARSRVTKRIEEEVRRMERLE
jgi:RNA polymerase sigma factor (sigma-70 family)